MSIKWLRCYQRVRPMTEEASSETSVASRADCSSSSRTIDWAEWPVLHCSGRASLRRQCGHHGEINCGHSNLDNFLLTFFLITGTNMLIRVHEESFVLFFFNSFILLDKKPFMFAVLTLVGAILMFAFMGNKLLKSDQALEYKL